MLSTAIQVVGYFMSLNSKCEGVYNSDNCSKIRHISVCFIFGPSEEPLIFLELLPFFNFQKIHKLFSHLTYSNFLFFEFVQQNLCCF